MTAEPKEWTCIVCLNPIAPQQYLDAAQIELSVEEGNEKLYFMRHGHCPMNNESRMRLVQQARMRRK